MEMEMVIVMAMVMGMGMGTVTDFLGVVIALCLDIDRRWCEDALL